MKRIGIMGALGLLAATGAQAGVSSTWTVINDYDFRGISLSATDPAIQASLDYTHESGFYVGAWASNADFGPALDTNYEVDLYAGFTGKINDDLGWSAGGVMYTWDGEYPNGGGSLDYPEFFGGLSYKIFSTKFWYSSDYSATGEDGYYFEGNVAVPLPNNFTLNVHAGYSFGDYWKNVNGDEPLDYSVGVGYTAGNFTLNLKYVDTKSDVIIKDDVFNNEGRVIFSVATTFPWSEK
jgi:uncharacterized protein (TIGR02001 family)